MSSMYAVTTTNLSKEYDGNRALYGINLRVKQGELYGLLGSNGAGKTTLLKLLTGFIQPTEGSASIWDKDPWSDRDHTLPIIGSLIETPVFYEHLSAMENLKIHLEYMKTTGDIIGTLRKVGLADAGKKPISKFSLGMRQRLAIARSIIHKPKVLLLDEPTNGLDPVAIREMRNLFHALKEEGVTILISSHILNEMIQTVECIGVINKGALILEENISDLKNEHPDDLEDYLIDIISKRSDVL